MIRLYQESDMKEIIDIWYQASLLAHSFLTEIFLEEEKNNLHNIFIPNSQTWVYEEGDMVIGFIALQGNEVGGIFIHPSKQRLGVGRALMDKANCLHDVLELEVFEKNHQGRSFYAKYGFLPIRKYKDKTTSEVMIRLRYEKKIGDKPITLPGCPELGGGQ
jgi:putative acetyltransferase